MALSDKQMLILDNLMYSNITTNAPQGATLGYIIKQIAKDGKKVTVKDLENFEFSGGLDEKEMAKILNEISKDEDLSELKIVKSIDNGIRATCFEDASGNATVAFRGTGGAFSQWKDNIEGFGEEVTPAQKQAADFINSLNYDNIDVTGHSKGGNLAKFVTIVCGDKIHRCVSYEGQGFSLEFFKKYNKKILANQHKIKQISGDTDFVNVLMPDVTLKKNNYYIKNPKGKFPHGSYKIYEDKSLFCDDGSFDTSKKVNRSFLTEAAYQACLMLCCMDISDPLTHKRLETFTDLLSVIVALGFGIKTGQIDLEQELINQLIKLKIKLEKIASIGDEYKEFYKNMKIVIDGIGNWIEIIIKEQIKPGIKYSEEHTLVEVDTDLLREYAARIDRLKRKSRNIDARLTGLYNQVGLLDLLKLLDVGLFDLTQSRLGKINKYLIDTAEEFESVESELSGI